MPKGSSIGESEVSQPRHHDQRDDDLDNRTIGKYLKYLLDKVEGLDLSMANLQVGVTEQIENLSKKVEGLTNRVEMLEWSAAAEYAEDEENENDGKDSQNTLDQLEQDFG